MKFTITTQELNYLINKILNVVGQKSTVPILSNFLIEAYNDELTITATDLSISLRCFTDTKIFEEGGTTLPAKKLAQLIRELTVPNVEISSNSNEVTTIVAGTSRFKINGMRKEDFPSLPDLSEADTFEIKQADLKELLYRTAFTVSKEDNRYTLTGVCLHVGDGVVTCSGTDGRRLARTRSPLPTHTPITVQSIIPIKSVEEILKNLIDEGMAKISITKENKLAIEANNTLIITKLLSGEYPDITRIIPERTEVTIPLHREELITLLRQISLFIVNPAQSVKFTFSNGELKVSANSKEIGEGTVGMPVNYQGTELDVAFSPVSLLEILRHCKEETVNLGLVDAYNPGMITEGSQPTTPDASNLFVLMPMRLSEE